MNTSGVFVFYAVFGLGFIIAGIVALINGRMAVPRRFHEDELHLEGGRAVSMGAVYLLWGVFLCLLAKQELYGESPNAFKYIIERLNWGDETGVAVLLVVNFGLIGITWFLARFFRGN